MRRSDPVMVAATGAVAARITDMLAGKPAADVVPFATVDEVASAMGWQRHTVRGLFSGTLKKKLGMTLASVQEERGRVYRISPPAQA